MDKSKFTKAIMYLTALNEQIGKINEEYGVDDNDVLYYHYFEGNDWEHHYQYVYHRHPEITHTKQPWELNIYTESKNGTSSKITYAAPNPKKLLKNIEEGKAFIK